MENATEEINKLIVEKLFTIGNSIVLPWFKNKHHVIAFVILPAPKVPVNLLVRDSFGSIKKFNHT